MEAAHPLVVAGRDTPAPYRAEQPGLGAITAMERFKLRKRPMTWITFGLLVGGVALIISLAYISLHASDVSPAERADRLHNFLLPNGITRSFQIVGFLGQILIVVLGASLIGAEYSWGTIRILVGTGGSRTRLLAAKLIALAQATIVYLVAATVVGSVTSLVVSLVSGHAVTLGTVDASWWGDLALMMVRVAYVLLVMGVFAFSIASLTRSVAAGIGIGIGWVFLERILSAFLGLLGNVGDAISKGLISTNTASLIERNGFEPQHLESGTPGAWQATGVLFVYTAVLLVVTFVVFRRRDITTGG